MLLYCFLPGVNFSLSRYDIETNWESEIHCEVQITGAYCFPLKRDL